MKKIFIIAGLLFLASCGNAELQEEITTDIPATPESAVVAEVLSEVIETQDEPTGSETPADEINAEVAQLETAQEDTSKTITLDAEYTNPRGPVDMTVSYTLDSEDKIASISVAATTYDVANFNQDIQSLVGSTLTEASEYKSGSSLTGPAFTSAIKTQLN